MEAPIPPPRLDDDEDVHWALSTAVALWGRSEHTEALKWLRRAAEQASDVNADKRALELFKAAADVANQLKANPSVPPPSPAPPPATPAPPHAAAPADAAPVPSVRPPPPPVPSVRHPPAPPQRPGSVFPPPPVARHAASPSVPAPPAPPAPLAPLTAGPGVPSVPRAPMPSVPSPPLPARSVPAPPKEWARSAPPPVGRAPAPPAPVAAAQVTAPARPVAISSAKAPMPQAIAPKRRRSFTGEPRPTEKPRAAATDGARRQPAAAAIAAQPSKRRRTHTDDDIHTRQTTPAAEKIAAIWDDLEEDTRVINGAADPGGDEIDQALARLRGAPAPVAPQAPAQPPPGAAVTMGPLAAPNPGALQALAPTPPAPPVAAFVAAPVSVAAAPSARLGDTRPASVMLPPAADEPQENPFAVPEPTMVMHRHGGSIHEELTSDGSHGDGFSSAAAGFRGGYGDAVAGPATERPPSMIDIRPAAPRRLDTLPSLRVAVLGTSVVGEVRLISLDAGDEPPPGAALAVLVPLSGADGEALARLFGATE